MKLLSFVFIGPLSKYRAIEAETLAKAMYNIAQNNSNGFRIYQSDQLQEIGQQKYFSYKNRSR